MKIFKIISCILTFVLLLSLGTAVYAAPNFTWGGRPQPSVSTYNDTLNYQVRGDSITITKCVDTASGDIEVPAQIDGTPVTSIGDYSFQHCKNITSVSLPNTITEIGYSAFYGCSALESINLPDSVRKIEYGAFYFCNSLKSAQIADLGSWCTVDIDGPYSNPAHIIGKLDFGTSVTELNIPEYITSVGRYTFYGCKDITNINIPANVTSIGECAFYGCSQLDGIKIPAGITEIGDGAFSDCPNIKIIDIADGNAYYRNINGGLVDLNSKTLIRGFNGTTIPTDGSVTKIGAYAFSGCEQITTFTVPDCVTSLGSSVFENCTALTSVVLPKNLTYINSSLFWNCKSLTSITIPETVTSIGNSAFRRCSALNNVTLHDGISEIRDYAFADCSSLTAVMLPKNIQTVENGVFAGCTALTSIEIPEGGKYYSRNNCLMLSNSVVAGCITSRIPDFATSIGISAFEGQSGLQNINIPESIREVKTSAFKGCDSLKTIYTGYTDKKKFATIKISGENDAFNSAERLYGNLDMPYVQVEGNAGNATGTDGNADEGGNSDTNAWVYFGLGGLLIVLIVVFAIVFTKRKKPDVTVDTENVNQAVEPAEAENSLKQDVTETQDTPEE